MLLNANTLGKTGEVTGLTRFKKYRVSFQDSSKATYFETSLVKVSTAPKARHEEETLPEDRLLDQAIEALARQLMVLKINPTSTAIVKALQEKIKHHEG